MSNPDISTEPSNKVYLWATLGGLGTILLFGALVVFAYYKSYKGPVTEDIVAQRYAKLAEVTANQHKLISSYEWIDQKNGIVRIPIDQAMKLVILNYQDKSKLN